MNYFYLQLKRIFSAYKKILFSTLIIFALVGIVVFTKFSAKTQNDFSTKLKLGIVGNDPSGYLDLGISALKRLDNFRFTLEFINLSNIIEAEKKLLSGELSAYAIIPDEFIQSLIDGRNKQITVIVRQAEMELGILVATELLGSISSLITETEAGIYTYHDFYSHYLRNYDSEKEKLELALNIEYLRRLLARDTIFQVAETSGKKSLSPQAYYFCSGLIFFLFIWSLSSIFLFIRSDDSMQKLLHSCGLNIFSLVASEWFSCFVLMILCLLPIFLSLIIFLNQLGKIVPEFLISYKFIIIFVLSFFPILCYCVSVEIFVSELCRDIISSIALIFIFSISLSYVSGFFFPMEILPKTFAAISNFLPGIYAFNLLANVLRNDFSITNFFVIFGYSIIFFLLSVTLKYLRIKKG